MIHTDREKQTWFDHLKGLFSRPAIETREDAGDLVMVRILPKRCPWCQDSFYTYQAFGSSHEPHTVDQDPPHGMGMRETCGHPLCWDAEDMRQWRRRVAFRAEHASSPAPEPRVAVEVM